MLQAAIQRRESMPRYGVGESFSAAIVLISGPMVELAAIGLFVVFAGPGSYPRTIVSLSLRSAAVIGEARLFDWQERQFLMVGMAAIATCVRYSKPFVFPDSLEIVVYDPAGLPVGAGVGIDVLTVLEVNR